MSCSDPIADMLARIRNAQMRGKRKVSIPASRLKASILRVLEHEGYIKGYALTQGESVIQTLEVDIKYTHGRPVIRELKRVSKPSLRRYVPIRKVLPVANGFGNAILSTSKGVLSDEEARRQHVGGEVLLYVS